MLAKEIRYVEPYTTQRYLHREDVVEWLKSLNLHTVAKALLEIEGVNNAPMNDTARRENR